MQLCTRSPWLRVATAMSSIRVRLNGKLFFDFRFMGVRCREQTTFSDTAANRRKMESVLKRIDEEISLGSFEYVRYFPTSQMLPKFLSATDPIAVQPVAAVGSRAGTVSTLLPRVEN